jgi:hypothetical protein
MSRTTSSTTRTGWRFRTLPRNPGTVGPLGENEAVFYDRPTLLDANLLRFKKTINLDRAVCSQGYQLRAVSNRHSLR